MEPSTKIPKLVAIVGAGVSGLGAAWKLIKNPLFKVTIFEKSQTLAGRVATRRRPGYFYDNGANYFSTDNPVLEDLIKNRLPHSDLITIKKPVWTFKEDGSIKEGTGDHDKNKYSYKGGIKTLGKLIWAECEGKAELKYEKRIKKIMRVNEGDQERWKLVSTEDEDLGVFDTVLLTPPAPQIADILRVSEFGKEGEVERLEKEFSNCPYKAIVSVAFALEKKIDKEYYALINDDRKHDISWLSFENDKEGHTPEEETVVVVQMANKWSSSHYDDKEGDIVESVFGQVKDLLKIDGKYKWGDVKKWRFALPEKAVDTSVLPIGEKYGLFFAGDFIKGKGRVLEAMEQGLNAAEDIQRIGSKSKL